MRPPPGESREDTAEWADLVSVIVNFLDAERFLREAIASVQAQSHDAWELILVDDGSTDAGTQIAKDHANSHPGRVRYLEHPGHENKGISASRNAGIRAARGALVAFLDADDVWRPHRLERSIELLRTNPRAAMVYGESEYWYSWAVGQATLPDRIQAQGFKADRVVPAPELLVRLLTHRAAVPCPSSITVRRAAALACGGFVESFRRMHEDQAFLARFCLSHDVYVAHECWDRYRQHDAGVCAVAERRGEAGAARQVYLSWLREFLDGQGMRGTCVWDALRYAERMERHQGRGWRARVARGALRAFIRAKLAMQPARRAAAMRRDDA